MAVGHGDERHAAGGRDAVRRLRLPRVRADRQPRRQDAQPHPGRGRAADGHPGPLRRRHRRRRAPLRLLGVVLRPHARPARASRRRPPPTPTGCCARRSPRPTRWSSWSPRSSTGPRTEVDLPPPVPGIGQAAVVRDRARDATLIAYGPSVPVALERRRGGRRGGPGPGGRRPALDRAVRRRDGLRGRPLDRPRRRRRRGRRLRQRRLRDRGPGHRALLPLTWPRRSAASPGSTSRTRRRSWSTTTCPASTGSSTPSTTCSGRTRDQRPRRHAGLHAARPRRGPDRGRDRQWLVAVGDIVAVDQPVVEVETAKSMVEVPCPYAGRVAVLHGAEGEAVDVGEPLITIAAAPGTGARRSARADRRAEAYREEEQAGSGNVLVGYGTSATGGRGRRRQPGPPPPHPRGAPRSATPAAAGRHGGVCVISPLVRRLAREGGLDLARDPADGRRADRHPGRRGARTRGREADPDRRSAARRPRRRAAPASAGPRSTASAGGVRGAVAAAARRSPRRPSGSTSTPPPCWSCARRPHARRPGPGLLAYIARFVVAGLHAYPVLNARLDTERDEIVESDASTSASPSRASAGWSCRPCSAPTR